MSGFVDLDYSFKSRILSQIRSTFGKNKFKDKPACATLSFIRRFDYQGCGLSTGDIRKALFSHWKEDVSAVLDQLTTGPQACHSLSTKFRFFE